MKLRRLKIHKFRNVLPGTELEFNDGFNVLLGQNGTGKTTLLRLISSVLRGDFLWLQNEAFALEADLELGTDRMTFAIKNERKEGGENKLAGIPREFLAFVPNNDSLSVTIDLRVLINGTEQWHLHGDSRGTTVSVPGLIEQSRAERWERYDFIHIVGLSMLYGTFIGIPKESRSGDASRFFDFFTTLGILHFVYRFDESLDLFSAITDRVAALGKEEFGHTAIRVGIFPGPGGTFATGGGTLLPEALLSLSAFKHQNLDNPSDAVGVPLHVLPSLSAVAQMLGFIGGNLRFDLLGKEVTDKQRSVEYGNLRFFFHGRDGSIVNQDHLSYGQKRLLTFFYYLACNPHVVVADELVNGLHHAWIAECIRAMGDRQVFVTSQNPILLDHLAFDSAETVRRTFITCQAKPEGPKDRFSWSNMSKKNAEAFFKAYKVGIQHVGEILRTKGLW